MKNLQKEWIIKSQLEEGVSQEVIVDALMKTRDLKDDQMHLSQITPEFVGIDIENLHKAIERVISAIEKKEKIIIYGDYDVDGITGAAILWETLYELGADCLPYVPHRIDEGYGLSQKGIENLLKKDFPSLIITVDNGIVANQAVDFAMEKNIDVIITDHHLPDESHALPNAHAIVHTTKLCGSSVALIFAKEIVSAIKKEKINFNKEHVILASLATVADLVPLTGANRVILKVGLEFLPSTERLGLSHLIKISDLDGKKIGVYEIGHVLAPRINATGRIESGMQSLRLLCTKDKKRAVDLAVMLDEINRKRQVIMKESADHAIGEMEKVGFNKVIVIEDSKFEEGVIGLIAGKLVEKYYVPSIAIALRDDVSKGSVRSIAGVNVIELLRSLGDIFINVGGHPMAAGFTIKTERIPEMKKKLNEFSEISITDELLKKKLTIDCQIPLTSVSKKLYEAIQVLSPFGMGNPQPVFMSKNLILRDKRLLGKEGSHVRLVISDANYLSTIEAIGFGMTEEFKEIDTDDTIDLVYTIDENTWNGTTKMQLKIKDVLKSDHIYDSI